MRSKEWEKSLAEEVNRVEERTASAQSTGKRSEDVRKRITAEFLGQFGPLLQGSIEKFNQSSPKVKIEFVKESKDKRGDKFCGLKASNRQFAFVETGRGFIRVDLTEGSSVQEAAFLIPKLTRNGDFLTWEEKNLLGFGNRLEPVTIDHLVRKYVTLLVSR